ncbi:MAG: hypothetical protein R2753_13690 [Chitinophagales bacterium]
MRDWVTNRTSFIGLKIFGWGMLFFFCILLVLIVTDKIKSEKGISKIENELISLNTRRVSRGVKGGYYSQVLIKLKDYPNNEFIVGSGMDYYSELQQIIKTEEKPIVISFGINSDENLDYRFIPVYCVYTINSTVIKTKEECLIQQKENKKEIVVTSIVLLTLGILSLIGYKKLAIRSNYNAKIFSFDFY